MIKPLFLFFLGIYLLFGATQVFGQNKCPSIKVDEAGSSWRIQNSAVECRSVCNSNSDCTVVKDKCGRMIFANKAYKDEIESFLNGSSFSCMNRVETIDTVDTVCERKRCVPTYKSCEAQIKKQTEFLNKKLSTECSSDADCTFTLAPDEKCIHRVPLGRVSDLSKSTLDLMYLRDSIIGACNLKNVKECNSAEKSYCVSNECIVFQEKPPFKNFVNLEGPSYSPNFASNTIPLKMPRASFSKCSQDIECTETTGVCSQYIVSINKKYLESFKNDIEKVEKSIACPVAKKIQIPKSRCFKQFCSFVN